MSNVNNWEFGNHLENFRTKVLEPQKKRVSEAEAIMHDTNRKWENNEQKKAAEAKCESFKQWLNFYQVFYDEGKKLIQQHEGLVNVVAKWYGKWYSDISNEGRQETEIMSIQADMLNDIFSEMYKEIQPLNLDIKPPSALNLK